MVYWEILMKFVPEGVFGKVRKPIRRFWYRFCVDQARAGRAVSCSSSDKRSSPAAQSPAPVYVYGTVASARQVERHSAVGKHCSANRPGA